MSGKVNLISRISQNEASIKERYRQNESSSKSLEWDQHLGMTEEKYEKSA